MRYRFLKLMPDSGDQDSEGPAQRTILERKRVRLLLNHRVDEVNDGEVVFEGNKILHVGKGEGYFYYVMELGDALDPRWRQRLA